MMWKGRLFAIFAVVFLALGSNRAEALVQSCMTCDVDYYGQNICVLFPSIGPEGGTRCYAGTWGCVTTQPCIWA
jgi:hypothetical protein